MTTRISIRFSRNWGSRRSPSHSRERSLPYVVFITPGSRWLVARGALSRSMPRSPRHARGRRRAVPHAASEAGRRSGSEGRCRPRHLPTYGRQAPREENAPRPIAWPRRPALICCCTPTIPVDWYPWGEEALAKAKAENKLIFLSIGYSSCYWCHVMERESFMDDEVAALPQQALCLHQGRPRRAARHRPDLHDGVCKSWGGAAAGR